MEILNIHDNSLIYDFLERLLRLETYSNSQNFSLQHNKKSDD